MRSKNLLPAIVGMFVALHSPVSLAGESCPIPKKAIADEDAAVGLAIRAVQAYKLTALAKEPLACLTFSYEKKGDRQYVNVRENRSKQCGGSPMTAPRIFSIVIDTDGSMSTDAYDHESDQPLYCVSKFQSINGKDKLPPDAIAAEFYEWYLHMLDVGHEPYFDDRKVLSFYVSKELMNVLKKQMAHSKDSDIDYFTQTVDFDTAWALHTSVSKPEIKGDTATVALSMRGDSSDYNQDLSLTFTRESNIWKIREVRSLTANASVGARHH